MGVARGEKFSPTRSDPLFPSGGLTLRAVAVPTAVIGNGGTISAAGALIDVPAEFSGTTAATSKRADDMEGRMVGFLFFVASILAYVIREE